MKRCSTHQQVLAAVGCEPTGIVAVDGIPLAGKTTLAHALGSGLGLKVVSADHYVNRKPGSYFSQLNLEALARAIDASRPCIFEGICCLQVLAALGLSTDRLVYVKKMAASIWTDEARLDDFASHGPDENTPTDPVALHLRNIWIEVASCHLQYKPHTVAYLTFERSAA
jgi:hypothetical protein